MGVPSERIECLSARPINPEGAYVLVWMVCARRASWSWMLQYARERAEELGLPLLVLEALRAAYPWASPRFHQFVIDGMRDNQAAMEAAGVAYYPYVEVEPGEGRGLLESLARDAAWVVTDYKPGFFQDRMQQAFAARSPCRVDRIDDNGLLPLEASGRAWPTAHGLRRHLQRVLPDHLSTVPDPDPFAGSSLPRLTSLPQAATSRWPMLTDARAAASIARLSGPDVVEGVSGGSVAASGQWTQFLRGGLRRYDTDRNLTSSEGTSRLSAALHFGHISSAQLVHDLLDAEGWTPSSLAENVRGSRTGWWGVSPAAEGFLDQVITWRELGHIFCHHVPDYDRWETLPAWAINTLEVHADDPRPEVYTMEELDQAATADPVWNAAQNQLREEGRIHNYLRMLWGKKVLQWSPHPREALATLIELNNRYALDGRDPNSYSGIFWCFGRFDRAWGPERPIFGKVRYMTSENTRRKFKLNPYLARWSEREA